MSSFAAKCLRTSIGVPLLKHKLFFIQALVSSYILKNYF